MRSIWIALALAIAYRVAFCFAMIFGMVSPKITTMMVIRIVDSQVKDAPSSRSTRMELSDEAAMLTRLFPIRIVDRESSNFSASFSARAALLSPSSAKFSRRIWLHEE